MHAVVTGGTGFLLGHVVRAWLRTDTSARVSIVSDGPGGPGLRAFLGPAADRVRVITGDVRRAEAWGPALATDGIDVVVHGAALCPMTPAEECARLAETVDVNVMGTVAVMDWARRLPGLRRVVYVSSGVYGYGAVAGPGAPADPPLPETAPLCPQDATYDITKAAGEWLAARYAALHGMDVAVRPSAIFGPMDRDTQARRVHVAPYHMARAALAGREVTVGDGRAGYDWLYAPDAGAAIAAIMAAGRTRHEVYNVSLGQPASLRMLAEGVARVIPGFRLREGAADPDIVQPANRRGGVWSPRCCQRLRDEFGWQPTPLPGAMARYVRWLQRAAA